MDIQKNIRGDVPQVGVTPYSQIHAHSTGNPNSSADNEAAYMFNKDLNTGFFTHVVGNGKVIQVANVNCGAWDVGGGWNYETYAAVELIESHKTQSEFNLDYALYVQLLRDLATQAAIPKTIDTGSTGILTHSYCTSNQPSNSSDHIDPYPYLKKWGISEAQFKKDVEGGRVTSGTTVNTTDTNKKKVGIPLMWTLITYKNAKYFYNGESLRVLSTPTEEVILHQLYNQTMQIIAPRSKLYDVPQKDWSGNAPTFDALARLTNQKNANS